MNNLPMHDNMPALSMRFFADFGLKNSTNDLTLSIIQEYAESVLAYDNGILATFKNKNRMALCSMEILNIVSNLITGNIDMKF